MGLNARNALSADAGEHEPAADPRTCSQARAACQGVIRPFLGPGASFLSFR